MKLSLSSIFIITMALSLPLLAQNEPGTPEMNNLNLNQSGLGPEALKLWRDFTNLPQERRNEFSLRAKKAQQLLSERRVFDSLQELDKADDIFPNHPFTINLRGAVYVQLRSFEKATLLYNEIIRLYPKNNSILFNLAEIDFVTKKWAKAAKSFQNLILLFRESQPGLIRICQFKLIVCHLKLNEVAEAKALLNEGDKSEDSPFYYYSRAAIAFHEGDQSTANQLITDATYVWRSKKALHPWQDTLIEAGYLKGVYGEAEDPLSN